jgi:hypothetical protein
VTTGFEILSENLEAAFGASVMATTKVVSTFFAKPLSPTFIARTFIAQPDGEGVEGAKDQLEQHAHGL